MCDNAPASVSWAHTYCTSVVELLSSRSRTMTRCELRSTKYMARRPTLPRRWCSVESAETAGGHVPGPTPSPLKKTFPVHRKCQPGTLHRHRLFCPCTTLRLQAAIVNLIETALPFYSRHFQGGSHDSPDHDHHPALRTLAADCSFQPQRLGSARRIVIIGRQSRRQSCRKTGVVDATVRTTGEGPCEPCP